MERRVMNYVGENDRRTGESAEDASSPALGPRFGTYERIDNGKILWVDLDLPDVIELKRRSIQESERRRFISKSFLEYDWLDQIKTAGNVLFIAAGVLYYTLPQFPMEL